MEFDKIVNETKFQSLAVERILYRKFYEIIWNNDDEIQFNRKAIYSSRLIEIFHSESATH